ncbi:hypothetical protein IscW_ISCW001156 [Ixodes scapularis]|uniref:Uncharacterized protein n=1 Tax=Ixodes scapularis TaxID=6945 RepID=B7P186_IXOSC|nr:hypothetical protein IscW_ISCW001156 [Ixodes scapularis]|eukprot:XP_002400612.1 hypothetical protein IscW_ISCW001156 [Ixodes scapularis]
MVTDLCEGNEDSVQDDYLVAALTKLGMPEYIIKFVKRTLAFQCTSLVCRQKEIDQNSEYD